MLVLRRILVLTGKVGKRERLFVIHKTGEIDDLFEIGAQIVSKGNQLHIAFTGKKHNQDLNQNHRSQNPANDTEQHPKQ